MKLKLLQLNINSENYWDKLVPYLTSNDFDIILLQEITGKDTVMGNINAKSDTFAELQKILKADYHGELSITQKYTKSPDAYFGNAIFYKKQFKLIKKNEITLSSFGLFTQKLTTYESVGRKVLHLTLEIANKQASFLTTHGAWGKDNIERPFQTEQGEILVTYLKTVTQPFILTGDFNITPEQPLIQKISSFTHNLITENNVTNTLNPKNHNAKHLFPKGLAVDYIFTSKDISVKNFKVVDKGLSDHFGLMTEIEI